MEQVGDRVAPETKGYVTQKVSQTGLFQMADLYICSFVGDFLNSTSFAHVEARSLTGDGGTPVNVAQRGEQRRAERKSRAGEG